MGRGRRGEGRRRRDTRHKRVRGRMKGVAKEETGHRESTEHTTTTTRERKEKGKK